MQQVPRGKKNLCQQAAQPGEESFKLGIKEQEGEMVMTYTLLKRLWTGLVRGHRVKAVRRDLENRIEGRGVIKSLLIFKGFFSTSSSLIHPYGCSNEDSRRPAWMKKVSQFKYQKQFNRSWCFSRRNMTQKGYRGTVLPVCRGGVGKTKAHLGLNLARVIEWL